MGHKHVSFTESSATIVTEFRKRHADRSIVAMYYLRKIYS